MNIKDIRIIPLSGSTPDGGWAQGYHREENLYTLIEIITDEGVVGLGSVFTSGHLVQGALEVLRPLLIGEMAIEPQRVSEKLHQSTFWQGRGGSITHAISGIDMALWDILGKITRQPVGRLLGGRYREKVKAYASILMAAPEQMSRRLRKAMERGFKAFKIGWGPFGRESSRMDEAIIRAARDTVGPEADLMVDAGGSDRYWPHGYKWALETARMLRAYEVTWFEEPLRPDDIQGYTLLTKNAPVPIAACEVLTRRQSFIPWIEQRAVDYLQPDVTKVGGLTEAHRIGMYAYDHSILLVPHGWNTAVGLAADLQLVSALPVARWIEYLTPAPYIEELVDTPFELDGEGALRIPSQPGLGMKWSQEGVKKHSGLALTPSVL